MISNGANGQGLGFYGAAAGLTNEWNSQTGKGPQGFDLTPVSAQWESAQTASSALYNALYGPGGLAQKPEYQVYSDELQAVLNDNGPQKRIVTMQHDLEYFGRTVRLLGFIKGDPRALETAFNATTISTTDFMNKVAAFQQWEWGVNQRAQSAKKAL